MCLVCPHILSVHQYWRASAAQKASHVWIPVSLCSFLFCVCNLGRGTARIHGIPHSNADMSFQSMNPCLFSAVNILSPSFIVLCLLLSVDHFSVPSQIVAVKKQMRDAPTWKPSLCCYLGFKLLDHQEAQPHWLLSVSSCVGPFWIDFIFIYIKTDPQLIDPEDIVTVTAGPFLDFTGSLLS